MANTTEDFLYQSERWFSGLTGEGIHYALPVDMLEAGATLAVDLYFDEMCLDCRTEIGPDGVPGTIDDDGFVLWESLAVTLYLAKKHALGSLYPATLEGEANAWKWSLWAVQEVDRGVNIWSLHAVRLPPEDRDPQRRAEALQVIAAPFKVLDGALAKSRYLIGDEFTVADLNVCAVISRAVDMDLTSTLHIADWLLVASVALGLLVVVEAGKALANGRRRSMTVPLSHRSHTPTGGA